MDVGRWTFLFLLLTLGAQAGDNWFLLPEPAFMGHKITIPIAGSKTTVLAAARSGEFGPDFATEEEWKNIGVTDPVLLTSARAQATLWLKGLKPELVRGANKVVDYARLSSDKIMVSATVLSPEFTRQFEDIFGPKPLVVIPNCYTVFIFPALAGNHDRFAPVVLAAWHSQAPRVSLEVFELGEKGLRAVGTFEE